MHLFTLPLAPNVSMNSPCIHAKRIKYFFSFHEGGNVSAPAINPSRGSKALDWNRVKKMHFRAEPRFKGDTSRATKHESCNE